MAPEAGRAASSTPTGADPAAPALYFAVLLSATLLGVAHESWGAIPWLYLERGQDPSRWVPALVGVVTGIGTAALVFRQRQGDWVALGFLLSASALAVAALGLGVFWLFGSGRSLGVPFLGAALIIGALLGASSSVAARVLGKTLVRLDAPWRLVNPFRLLAIGLACGVGAALASSVGPLRASLALGLVLGALALWAPALGWYLERRPLSLARGARLTALGVLAACGAAFLWTERLLPSRALHAHPNPVVYHLETELQELSVTSGQDAFELFVDGKLKASTVDEVRYFEALVQPALALSKRRTRVLLLGGGTGLAEREVLDHDDVEGLTVVVLDRALVELSRRVRWLSRRADGALGSPRVRVVEAEPIVWLGETGERFDVAIVDLPDPEGYLEGKSYSRYFFRALAARLAPEGVIAVQGMSPFDAPTSFATVLATLEAAGLRTLAYHAAVPTIGDWGFVLGFLGELPAETDWSGARARLSGATLGELRYLPGDMRPKSPGRPSLLSDQHLVDTYRDERGPTLAP